MSVLMAPDVASFMGGLEAAVVVSVPVVALYVGVKLIKRFLGQSF